MQVVMWSVWGNADGCAGSSRSVCAVIGGCCVCVPECPDLGQCFSGQARELEKGDCISASEAVVPICGKTWVIRCKRIGNGLQCTLQRIETAETHTMLLHGTSVCISALVLSPIHEGTPTVPLSTLTHQSR